MHIPYFETDHVNSLLSQHRVVSNSSLNMCVKLRLLPITCISIFLVKNHVKVSRQIKVWKNFHMFNYAKLLKIKIIKVFFKWSQQKMYILKGILSRQDLLKNGVIIVDLGKYQGL